MTNKKPKRHYEAWRKSNAHLPDILKDFHDQKDVFKTMHQMIGESPKNISGKTMDFVDGHIYAIDVFLWFMARHGYTLQRSRANVEFDSIERNIKYFNDLETLQFKQMFEEAANRKKEEEEKAS